MESLSFTTRMSSAPDIIAKRRWNVFHSDAPDWFRNMYLGNPAVYWMGIGKVWNTSFTAYPTSSRPVINSFTYLKGTTTPNWSVYSRNRLRLSGSSVKKGYLTAYPVPRWNPPKFKMRMRPKKPPATDRVRTLLWQKSLLNWEIYDKRRKAALDNYTSSYLKKVGKYNKRLEIIASRKERLKKSLLSTRKAGTGFAPDNAYTRLKVIWDSSSNPYVSAVAEISGDPYLYQMNENTTTLTPSDANFYCKGMPAGLLAFFAPEIDPMKEKLTRKFFDKLGNQKVHLGNIIAERAQTVQMFSTSVMALSKLLLAKKFLFSLASHLKPSSIANKFLAFKFGVEPLVNDLSEAAKLLAELSVEEDSDTIVVRTNSKRFVSINRMGATFAGLVEVSLVCKYRVANSVSKDLQQLGLVNPAEIAWEVMPWSFVVDWFLPIGKFISSLSAETGLEFISGTYGVKIVGRYNCSSPVVYSNPMDQKSTITSDGILPCGSLVLQLYDRSVLSTSPNVSLPVVKNPLSLTHGLEAAALFVQRIRHK